MLVSPTNFSGILRFISRRFGDARGHFSESWNKRTLEEAGVFLPDFVQDNHSLSSQVGTMRGLYYEAPPYAQGKLKAEHDLPPSDPAREAAQIERLEDLAKSADLDPEFAREFLNFIIAEVIRHHQKHQS